MRWSARKLRWVLLGGLVLLTAVVASFFGLARYRAGKIWQRILARNGVNLQRESNGITLSQSSKGRTSFTLHASRMTPLGRNKWALHDAVMILYGHEPGRDDRVSGKEFEYDQDAGVVRALGEVHMDLQAPAPGGKARPAGMPTSLDFSQASEAADDPGVIHVRTSGVVYMRKLGVAATGEQAEFRYGGITCTSKGAEFDSAQSVVRLLADVHMTGTLRKGIFSLLASHAELNRTANTADLIAPVLTSGDRGARAAHALLHLHKDGSLEAAEANGGMELRTGTRTISAPQAMASFGAENKPEHAHLFNSVSFTDADRNRPAQGSAQTLDLTWNATGLLNTLVAEGAVRAQGSAPGEGETRLQRQIAADRLVATFTPDAQAPARKARLNRVDLTGAADVRSSRQPGGAAQGVEGTEIHADALSTTFLTGADGRSLAQSLSGQGHTRLERTAKDGARQASEGDRLEVKFSQSAGVVRDAEEVSSAIQSGHVNVVSLTPPKAGAQGAAVPVQTTGHADRAVYLASESTLTLTGTAENSAEFDQPQGQMRAAEIVVHQGTGDAEARGGVVATTLGQGDAPASHVVASRARLLHSAQMSEFFGDGDRPAQLWQGGSQVQAAQITLDGQQHTLAARPAGESGMIRAVFATAGDQRERSGGKGPPPKEKKANRALGVTGGAGETGEDLPAAGRNSLEISAGSLNFDELHHEALFNGNVRVNGTVGQITADRGTAFLRPEGGAKATSLGSSLAGGPDLGGALDRMVLLGDVQLAQPGRTGVGQQLTYVSATDTFALTGAPGKPPRVTAEHGSVVTGATLVFRSTDSTIVVAGTEGGSKAAGGGRVHTETDLKQNH